MVKFLTQAKESRSKLIKSDAIYEIMKPLLSLW
jgi:hypothetical protein